MSQNVQPIYILKEGTTQSRGRSAQRSNITAAMVISDAVKKNPQIGISKHLHIGLVKRHGFSLQPNDRVEFPGSHMHIDKGSGGSILSVDVKKAIINVPLNIRLNSMFEAKPQ